MNEEYLQHLANAITVLWVRNDPTLETIHKGKNPISKVGDFSDVFVVDAKVNKISWNEISRITQDEMKSFMKNTSNHIYDFLYNIDDESFLDKFNLGWNKHWIGIYLASVLLRNNDKIW